MNMFWCDLKHLSHFLNKIYFVFGPSSYLVNMGALVQHGCELHSSSGAKRNWLWILAWLAYLEIVVIRPKRHKPKYNSQKPDTAWNQKLKYPDLCMSIGACLYNIDVCCKTFKKILMTFGFALPFNIPWTVPMALPEKPQFDKPLDHQATITITFYRQRRGI